MRSNANTHVIQQNRSVVSSGNNSNNNSTSSSGYGRLYGDILLGNGDGVRITDAAVWIGDSDITGNTPPNVQGYPVLYPQRGNSNCSVQLASSPQPQPQSPLSCQIQNSGVADEHRLFVNKGGSGASLATTSTTEHFQQKQKQKVREYEAEQQQQQPCSTGILPGNTGKRIRLNANDTSSNNNTRKAFMDIEDPDVTARNLSARGAKGCSTALTVLFVILILIVIPVVIVCYFRGVRHTMPQHQQQQHKQYQDNREETRKEDLFTTQKNTGQNEDLITHPKTIPRKIQQQQQQQQHSSSSSSHGITEDDDDMTEYNHMSLYEMTFRDVLFYFTLTRGNSISTNSIEYMYSGEPLSGINAIDILGISLTCAIPTTEREGIGVEFSMEEATRRIRGGTTTTATTSKSEGDTFDVIASPLTLEFDIFACNKGQQKQHHQDMISSQSGDSCIVVKVNPAPKSEFQCRAIMKIATAKH